MHTMNRFVLALIALLSLAAVANQAHAWFSNCETNGCATSESSPGGHQDDSSCSCACHDGMGEVADRTHHELQPLLCVAMVSEKMQHVPEAPPHPIELPPQLI